MKKYLSILILATFIGLLSPITNIHAQAIGGGNGTCSIAVITDSTNCTQQGGVWTPNSTSTSPGCHDNNGVPIPLTEDACKVAGYSWTDIPPASSPTDVQSTYTYLAPIGTDKTFDPSQENALSIYLNIIIKTLIGLAAVLAMVMIVMGGIEYATSDLVSSKEAGKKRITDAIIGLLLALSAYLLLYTINPNLLKVEPNIPSTDLTEADHPSSMQYEKPPSGLSGPVGGNATNNTKVKVTAGATFSNQTWQNAALAAVQNSGLASLNPSDGATWFGHAGPYTAAEWVSLLVGIASAESNLDPNATYVETQIPGNPTSVGLFQLSVGDCAEGVYGYGKACTDTELKDPVFNINLAVGILYRWIVADGVVDNSTPKYLGAAHYWSTMRSK